jgi:mRNA interferase MazF
MQKNFTQWNNKKISIHGTKSVPFFHEREIWFCSLGVNIGFEQDGQGADFQRPVVIIKKFNNDICWVVPLSKTKRRGEYYFAFPFNSETTSVALLSQIKLLDAHRFSRKIGSVNEENFRNIIEKLKELFP